MHTLGTKGARGMEERARLVRVEHDRRITKETDSQFLFEYQRAILMSLKGRGSAGEAQYTVCGRKTEQLQLRAYNQKTKQRRRKGEET